MPDDSKKIFVSYRRKLSTDFVLRLRDHLKAKGFDVFVDVQSIPRGKFAEIILHQIEARPHFLAVLVPGSLRRTTSRNDWYRREIEHAIAKERNIIPVRAKRFDFDQELELLGRKDLPGRLEELREYQDLEFVDTYDEFYEASIARLVKKCLVVPKRTRVVPTPIKERETVREMFKVADLAKVDRSGSDWVLPLGTRSLFMPLPAPKLAAPADGKFTWTRVAGASGYVLQVSQDEAFSKPDDLYSGEKTEFLQPPKLLGLSPLALAGLTPTFGSGAGTNPIGAGLWTSGLFGTRYYRVKAKAGLGRLDSPWSKVVKVEPPQPLPAPKLKQPASDILGRKWAWTAIDGAAGYLLQTSRDEAFSKADDLYTGDKTEFVEPSKPFVFGALALAGLRLFGTRYYRVKAKANLGRLDSLWSNVVEVEPPKPLPAPKLEVSWRLGGVAQLTWSAVDGAIGYLLQTSRDQAFTKPEELYNGTQTEFLAKSESPGQGGTGSGFGGLVTGTIAGLQHPNPLFSWSAPRYYRVKAVAGPGRLDSPWSDIV